jgi:hypothetical protein
MKLLTIIDLLLPTEIPQKYEVRTKPNQYFYIMLNVKGFPACNHELSLINLYLMFMSNMKSLYIKI